MQWSNNIENQYDTNECSQSIQEHIAKQSDTKIQVNSEQQIVNNKQQTKY